MTLFGLSPRLESLEISSCPFFVNKLQDAMQATKWMAFQRLPSKLLALLWPSPSEASALKERWESYATSVFDRLDGSVESTTVVQTEMSKQLFDGFPWNLFRHSWQRINPHFWLGWSLDASSSATSRSKSSLTQNFSSSNDLDDDRCFTNKYLQT